jgi:hypothetical protein
VIGVTIGWPSKVLIGGSVSSVLIWGAACGGDRIAPPLVPDYVPDGMVVTGSSWSEPGPRERDPTDPEWTTVVPTGVDDPFDGPTLSLRRDQAWADEPPPGEAAVDLDGVSAAVWHGPSQHMVSWVLDGSLLTLTGRWVDEAWLIDVARSIVTASAGQSPSEWLPEGWTVAHVADITDGHSSGSLELASATGPPRSIGISWNAGGASLFDFHRAGAPAPSTCVERSLAACDVTFEIAGRQALRLGTPHSGIIMWVSQDGRLAQASTWRMSSDEVQRVIESVRPSSWNAVDDLSARTHMTTNSSTARDASVGDP